MDSSISIPQLKFAISIDDMYKLAHKNDTTWGIEGYEVKPVYQDPIRQIQERENAIQKKTQKSKQKVPPRGNFIDDQVKMIKFVPGPQKYDVSLKWTKDKDKDKKGPKPPADKDNFLDQIIKREKKCGVPGIGKYDVEVPLKQVLEKIEVLKKKKHILSTSEKVGPFLQNESIGASLPGVGEYNPRQILPKLRINTTTPKSWIEKHQASLTTKSMIKLPPVGTYDPYPVEFPTFGSLLLLKDQNKDPTKKRPYWGSEERFKINHKSKSMSALSIPSPNQYDLQLKWPSKFPEKDQKKSWIEKISKGITKSIYY